MDPDHVRHTVASRSSPNLPIDRYRPPWDDFAQFFDAQTSRGETFLIERRGIEGSSDRSWTRPQWRSVVHATARRLISDGVREGDVVAVLAENDVEAVAVAFALWNLGACYLPLSRHEPPARLRLIVEDAAAVLIAITTETEQLARAAGFPESMRQCSISELVEVEPEPSTSPEDPLPAPAAGLAAPALRVYTSGTTGRPKGVTLPAESLLLDCEALAGRLDWPADARILTVLPIHHVNGLIVSNLLAWYAGHSTVLCRRFRSSTFWEDACETGATVVSLVPSLLEFLIDAPLPKEIVLTEVLCGAGPLSRDTIRRFEDRFGLPLRHLYGLSETTAVATLMPRLDEEARGHWYLAQEFPSVGPAVEHVEVAVLDAQDDPLPAGVRGEIAVRGRTVMDEYAGMPEETAAAFRGGWFHTGDEGYHLPAPDGTPYFFISGRMKELIIRGGVNLSPLVIDEVLGLHPAVVFGLAIGFENRYYGEEVAAYVVPRGSVSADEILEHCAKHLDHAHRPKVIVFGEDIPYTSTGKPRRLQLAEMLAAELSAHHGTQFRN